MKKPCCTKQSPTNSIPEVLLETDENALLLPPRRKPKSCENCGAATGSCRRKSICTACGARKPREALAEFIRESVKRGLRCLRVIHGKGLGSIGKEPVLKGKVRAWLVQKNEVIAFSPGAAARRRRGRGRRAASAGRRAGSRRAADGAAVDPSETSHSRSPHGGAGHLCVRDFRFYRGEDAPPRRGRHVPSSHRHRPSAAVSLRDVLLERRPFYWVEHQGYLIAIFVMSLFAPTLLKMTSRLLSERVLLVADAIGLGLFSIAGTLDCARRANALVHVRDDGRGDGRASAA